MILRRPLASLLVAAVLAACAPAPEPLDDCMTGSAARGSDAAGAGRPSRRKFWTSRGPEGFGRRPWARWAAAASESSGLLTARDSIRSMAVSL